MKAPFFFDGDALTLSQQQWAVYRKFVDTDYGSSAGAYQTLHRLVRQVISRPFSFLDLACGDARGTVAAPQGTAVAHYHGVDLAPPALQYAAQSLDSLDCEIDLEHGYFIEAIRKRLEPADYPETMESWETLGREAGFAKTGCVYTGSRDLFRMFCFSG